MSDGLRERVAQTLYGDGDELPWARCVQLADLVLWELDGTNRLQVGRCVCVSSPEGGSG